MQGSAPTISVDNTSGCQLYLSSSSLGASITTAKSSEINVLVPGAGPDSDWVRFFHIFLIFIFRLSYFADRMKSYRLPYLPISY